MTLTNIKVFTANSIPIKIANNAHNYKESNVFEDMKEERRVVGGINYILKQDKRQSTIRGYGYNPPIMCCYYWEITLLDGQEVVVRYCTNEEKFS